MKESCVGLLNTSTRYQPLPYVGAPGRLGEIDQGRTKPRGGRTWLEEGSLGSLKGEALGLPVAPAEPCFWASALQTPTPFHSTCPPPPAVLPPGLQVKTVGYPAPLAPLSPLLLPASSPDSLLLGHGPHPPGPDPCSQCRDPGRLWQGPELGQGSWRGGMMAPPGTGRLPTPSTPFPVTVCSLGIRCSLRCALGSLGA